MYRYGRLCRPNVERPFDFVASVYRAYEFMVGRGVDTVKVVEKSDVVV